MIGFTRTNQAAFLIATMQNRFRRLDIFSISVILDRLFAIDIGGSNSIFLFVINGIVFEDNQPDLFASI